MLAANLCLRAGRESLVAQFGQSTTLIMWGSAVQVRPGLPEGVWLSWLEHLLCKQGVTGSNPVSSTGWGPRKARHPRMRPVLGARFYDMMERTKQEYKSENTNE